MISYQYQYQSVQNMKLPHMPLAALWSYKIMYYVQLDVRKKYHICSRSIHARIASDEQIALCPHFLSKDQWERKEGQFR